MEVLIAAERQEDRKLIRSCLRELPLGEEKETNPLVISEEQTT